MSFTIAIIGRPNVGKSTLFNRLVGQKLALVDDEPGVTRDRREGEARLGDLEFTVIDTAGLDEGAKGSLTARMQEQTETAIGARRCPDVRDRRARGAHAERSRLRRFRAPRQQAGGSGRQQERGQAGRCRRDGSLRAGPRRTDPDFGRAWRGPQRSLRRAARADAGARDEGEAFDDDDVIESDEEIWRSGRSAWPSSAAPMPASPR